MMLLQQRQPPFLSIPSVIFNGSLLMALKRAALLVVRRGCRQQTSRWRELLRILRVNTDVHAGSQALGSVG